jgi:hypothetical protein
MRLLDQPLGAPLVLRIAIGVEEQEGERLGAVAHRLRRRGQKLCLVERDQHPAAPSHALIDLEPHRPANQRLVLAEEQVVGFRPVDAADLVDVAKAPRGEQRAAGAFALQQRIDRNRGAVQEQRGIGERASGVVEGAMHAVDQPGWRRQHLAEPQFAGLAGQHCHVGERAADIGGDPQAIGCETTGC